MTTTTPTPDDSHPHVEIEPLAELAYVTTATESLLESASQLAAVGPRGVGTPSLLPGWTRGHVLTHLARNADGLVNLLYWARTGIVTPAYPSPQARAADIEAGAHRGPAELVADVRDSAARFHEAAATLPAERWEYVLDRPEGPMRAARIVWMRRREIEVHHADLGLDYTPAHWPDDFTAHGIAEAAKIFRASAAPLRLVATDTHASWTIGAATDVTVEGPQAALFAWLTGRASGDGLTVEPHGPLPELPPWL